MNSYKKDFPILKNKNLIYLDSSATSQKPKAVLDSILEYYQNYNANVRRGLYPIAEKATEKVEEVRRKVAKFINAKYPEEIIFTRNATEAINLVAYAFASQNIKRGDRVVTTIMEHHSNFVPWQQLCEVKGARLEVLDISDDGILILDEKKIKGAKLVALTHVSNVLGTINPIKQIIKKLKPNSSHSSSLSGLRAEGLSPIVIIDAAQSVPHMKVNVQELNCDFLAFSGHKMLAATGIGILYGKKVLLEGMQPFLYGGEMIEEVRVEKTTFLAPPYKFEAGTPDIAGIISLGGAIDYLEEIGIDKIQKHEKELVAYCLSLLSRIDGVTIYGPKDRGGLIAFNIDGIHAHDVAQVLGDMGICIRSGHHCAMPLHKRLGVPASARVSFYIYNDKKDVDRLIEGIKKVKKIFRVNPRPLGSFHLYS